MKRLALVLSLLATPAAAQGFNTGIGAQIQANQIQQQQALQQMQVQRNLQDQQLQIQFQQEQLRRDMEERQRYRATPPSQVLYGDSVVHRRAARLRYERAHRARAKHHSRTRRHTRRRRSGR